jgi:hypothetical protein
MNAVSRRAVGALAAIVAVATLVFAGLAAGNTRIDGAAGVRTAATAGVREAAFKRAFSGSGNRKLGTLRLRRSAVLRWRTRGGLFQVSERHGFLLVNTRARRGHLLIHRGVYRGVRVAARSRWTISIRSR